MQTAVFAPMNGVHALTASPCEPTAVFRHTTAAPNAVGRGENCAVGLERGERENGFFGLLILGESDHEGQHINQSRDDSFHSFL